MPMFEFIEIDGTKVMRLRIKDTKAEQLLMAIFAKQQQAGFVLAHRWLPGVSNDNRADTNRCVSILDLFTAPVIGGKAAADLPAAAAQNPEPGKASVKPESLDIPPEIAGMKKLDLLSFAPRVGAKVNQRMEEVQLKAAICLAIQRNPKNWETIKAQMAASKPATPAAGPGPKPEPVGAL